MTSDNVDDAIEALPRVQQHVDLWTILQSPNFKSGTNVEPYFSLWRNVRSLTLDIVLEWRQGFVISAVLFLHSSFSFLLQNYHYLDTLGTFGTVQRF